MSKQLSKWVVALKDGDQSAFLPLYEKTAPGLMRFLLWKTGGDRPLAEDVMQESFVRFLVSLDRLESVEEMAVQSYLLQIVKNCLIDKAARVPTATRPHVSVDLMVNMEDTRSSYAQERAVEMRELAIAMESLSEKDSEIIWLRDALGLSHREVAERVGITEQASRQAYVRAKRTLVSELADGWKTAVGGAYATVEVP